MADRVQNPFNVPVVQDEDSPVDPFAVLRAVSAPVRTSPAKQITDALTPDAEPEDVTPPRPGVGPGSRTGGDPEEEKNFLQKAFSGQFKKGALAGMDKQVFFAMIADSLTAIGTDGKASSKFTRMSLERKQRSDEVAARQQQIKEDREFTAEQNLLDRTHDVDKGDKASTEKDLDRSHERRLAELRIGAASQNLERNHELAQEMIELEGQEGLAVQQVSEVFKDVQLFPDLRLPAHITPATAKEDPKILEEARRLIAPHARELVFSRLKAARGDKAVTDQQQKLGSFKGAEAAWRGGRRMVSQEEQQLTGNFNPFTPITNPNGEAQGTPGDMAALDVAAVGIDVLNDDFGLMQAKQQWVREAFEDFQLHAGPNLWELDDDIRRMETGRILGSLVFVYDHAVTEFKAQHFVDQGQRGDEQSLREDKRKRDAKLAQEQFGGLAGRSR